MSRGGACLQIWSGRLLREDAVPKGYSLCALETGEERLGDGGCWVSRVSVGGRGGLES